LPARDVYRAAAVFPLAPWLLSGACAAGREAPKRPSFVLIVTDDQDVGTLASMPRLQRLLAAGGSAFTNAYVPITACSPS